MVKNAKQIYANCLDIVANRKFLEIGIVYIRIKRHLLLEFEHLDLLIYLIWSIITFGKYTWSRIFFFENAFESRNPSYA